MFLHFLTIIFLCFLQIKLLYSTCGYKGCHPTKNGLINVHIIPHSHDDVGWTKTVDQYYADSNGYDVRAILTSTYQSLLKDPSRRFIYVESAFFFKWWNEQNEVTKAMYKKLVDSGQLEFISGAWSMNDEATTSYQAIIDQFTLGLRKLNETFGECGRPKVGWQIDPFGHSSEMASILSQLGFDGLFLGRIDYQDKNLRMKTQSLEMIWQGSRSLGAKSEIFTSVLYNTYFAPDGFSWDMWSGNPDLDDYNIGQKWKDLVNYMDTQTRSYLTKNIIITMGGDFNYMYAESYFKNLDRLIKYANLKAPNNNKYHLLYSTPSCYLKAVHEEATARQISWPLKTDDFFPYADSLHAYWTGYFTSRPSLKYFERLGNNFLQISKQLSVLANLDTTHQASLNSLKESMGVLQHHDAVSGTEQDHVAKDYARMLSSSIDKCGVTCSTALRQLAEKNQAPQNPHIEFHSCLLSNISECSYSEESSNFIVTIYNPLSRPVDLYVRLPVMHDNYTVTSPSGDLLPTQLVPIPQQVSEIPGRRSEATDELVFQAFAIPPLGFNSYYVSKGDIRDYKQNSGRPAQLKKQKVNLRIGRRHGLLKKIVVGGKRIPIRQEFFYYKGAKQSQYRASGAYVFRPEGNKLQTIAEKTSYKIYSGSVVNEVHQTFNNWVSQVIRMYRGASFVELAWLVGPLPNDGIGREVISHFRTHLKNNGTFYTDSNCRETLKRVRDYRPTWNLSVNEEISGNYYPINSKIHIKDHNNKLEVAILTDRSQGGSSIHDGEIEVMVHRNTMYDDKLGVVEPLNEYAFGKPLVARGSHWIVAGSGDEVAELERNLAERRLLSSWTFVSPTQNTYSKHKELYNMEYSGLTSALPRNIKILTLERLYEVENGILLRLEHTFEVDEHSKLSKPVQVKLKDLFGAFSLVSIRETTLAANQWLSESSQLVFSSKQVTTDNGGQAPNIGNDFTVELRPMQIRTFIVIINRK